MYVCMWAPSLAFPSIALGWQPASAHLLSAAQSYPPDRKRHITVQKSEIHTYIPYQLSNSSPRHTYIHTYIHTHMHIIATVPRRPGPPGFRPAMDSISWTWTWDRRRRCLGRGCAGTSECLLADYNVCVSCV